MNYICMHQQPTSCYQKICINSGCMLSASTAGCMLYAYMHQQLAACYLHIWIKQLATCYLHQQMAACYLQKQLVAYGICINSWIDAICIKQLAAGFIKQLASCYQHQQLAACYQHQTAGCMLSELNSYLRLSAHMKNIGFKLFIFNDNRKNYGFRL